MLVSCWDGLFSKAISVPGRVMSQCRLKLIWNRSMGRKILWCWYTWKTFWLHYLHADLKTIWDIQEDCCVFILFIITLSISKDLQYNMRSLFLTPWKKNMEPTNHPFRKEHDLPGCIICEACFLWDTLGQGHRPEFDWDWINISNCILS